MGSMVPLEVSAAREERPPASEPDSYQPQTARRPRSFPPQPRRPPRCPRRYRRGGMRFHDVPAGWQPERRSETPARDRRCATPC